MALLDNPTRIDVSEFPSEQQQMVERIAEIYNHFSENVTNVVNGNLSYENYNKKLITVQLTVGSNGIPVQLTRFSSTVGLKGTSVIKASNLANTSVYALSQPFVSFTPSGSGIYTINHVSGLQASNKYELVIELSF